MTCNIKESKLPWYYWADSQQPESSNTTYILVQEIRYILYGQALNFRDTVIWSINFLNFNMQTILETTVALPEEGGGLLPNFSPSYVHKNIILYW